MNIKIIMAWLKSLLKKSYKKCYFRWIKLKLNYKVQPDYHLRWIWAQTLHLNFKVFIILPGVPNLSHLYSLSFVQPTSPKLQIYVLADSEREQLLRLGWNIHFP